VSLSCASDTDCKVKLHFTNDSQHILHVNQYNVKADIPFHIYEGVTSKYFKASILNDSGNDQTKLNVDCIYSNNSRDALIVSFDASTININTDGLATEATLADTYNLLNNNIGTGGLSVSLTALNGDKITNTLLDAKRGLDVNLINDVNVVDVSLLAKQSTQADILLMAERQDLNGVKINSDHPALTTYDFVNNHVAMTMKGPTNQDIRWEIDSTNNRDGWKFTNIHTYDPDASNCYFYANGAGTGNSLNLIYSNFTSFYTVVTMDMCDSVNDCPFFVCYSYPTGTNDVIPTFAHSKWQFVLPSGSQLFQSEKVVLYYGAIPNVHSNLRHLPLVLTSIGNNGERLPTELIYLMTINTQSGRAQGKVIYMLHNAGFTALGQSREYEFSNSLERKKLANLSSTNIPVAVSNFPLPLSSVSINNFPATQPVSGTFWQATQPVSGSFYQATQPVSIVDAVAVSNNSLTDMSFYDTGTYGKLLKVLLPELTNVHIMATESDIPVSGSFYQATQPVSISDIVAVSGSFYQATQPVSGTVDTHMYANSSANNQIKVHCDNQGYLLTGIVDVSENRVTTSAVNGSRGLDVNVVNGTSTTPLYTRALTSSDVVSSNVKSGSGTAITSTVVSTKTGLDVNVCNSLSNAPLYCTPGVDIGSNVNTGWNNSSLTASSVSSVIDIQWSRTVSVLCRASGTGTLVIQVSVDNTNFYTTTATITLSGTADSVINYSDIGARYIRLKSNSIVSGVYATICGK
jgi:hypothetical protein